MRPSVVIIMRAKDEMPYAFAALQMLKQQTIPYVFYAIDSGSTDGTLEALINFDANLERIRPEDYVPGRVLNNAIAKTEGEIVVLLNADAIPLSPSWLERLISPIAEGVAEATFSRQVARKDARFIVAYDYARAYDSTRMGPGFFSAVACAFKRDLWKTHPFRESGYAEDTAWAKACLADGTRFQFVESAAVEHSHNYPLKKLFQKRYRQAVTLNEKPSVTVQTYRCLREITRDLLYAVSRFQLHTIPYNMAYRVMIHRGFYRGLRDSEKRRKT